MNIHEPGKQETEAPEEGIQVEEELPLWKIRLILWGRNMRDNIRLFWNAKIGIIGLVIILFFALFAAAYPLWVNQNPNIYDPLIGFDAMSAPHPSAPSWAHPLGTDLNGRDILSQLMFGTRIAFIIGIIAALFTATIATIVGAVAAYFRGIIDTIFMRLANLLMLFPFVAFIPVLSGVLEITFFRFAVIIGLLSGFGATTLIMKSRALNVVNSPYIDAARVCGGGSIHIISTHVIPNILSLSFLYMMFTVQGAIFSEAVLSWLGFLNVRMSWGIMLHTSQRAGYLVGAQLTRYWWMWLPSGLSITLLCAAFYLVGRGLDPVINPRLRKR